MPQTVTETPIVALSDEFGDQSRAGLVHAEAYYADKPKPTLVGSLSAKDLSDWDGATEMALVSDSHGIDIPDQEF